MHACSSTPSRCPQTARTCLPFSLWSSFSLPTLIVCVLSQNELERLRQMLGHEVGTYLGGTAAFLPYIPSPVPIQSNIDYQQRA